VTSTDSELSCSCCFKAPKFSHVSAFLRSLHWLKIIERIDYKLLSLTYKVLTTYQPSYLRDLVSVHRTRCTRSSSVVTLACTPVTSSLKITNRCFRHASPRLRKQLPQNFINPILVLIRHRQLHHHHHHYSLSLYLYFTLALKLFFSTNPSRSRCLSPTGLPSWTPTASVLLELIRFLF